MSTLYDLINILPLSLLSVMIFGSFTGMPEGSIAGFLICLVLSLWTIILRNMKRKNRLRGIGIVTVFFIGLLIAAGEENRERFLEEHFWVIWVVCITAAALIAGIIMCRSVWARRICAAALIVYCAVFTVLGREIGKETFALICFILFVRITEEIQRKWEKSGCPDLREHITRISPVLLALCIIVYVIPAPEEPYDWQFAKDIYSGTASVINRIYGFFSHPSDDYGSVGFSDSGGFLAGLGGNDEEVLNISAGNTAIKSLRLVGCISGNFRGREWLFDTTSESYSRMTDTLETSCALRKYAGALQSDYLQKTNLHCKTYFYNTRYIFSPAKIRLGATGEKTAGISEKNGSIVSEQRLSYDDEYLVSCYVLNYGNPDLAELLGSAEPIDEAEWAQTAKAEDVLGKDGCSFDDYQKYRKYIYDNFCHSYAISDDVRTILDEIGSSSENRYDVLKKLEKYLKKLEYSTDCGALPDSVTDAGSFLDHFLLNSKKGYCMHFATAFVLMANELGIPCRYVQGYNVKRDVTGSIVVKQSDAHAWPEAYFDNVGWVAFEPTPGYSVPAGWGSRTAYESDSAEDVPEPEDGNDEEADGSADDGHNTAAIDPLIFIIPSIAVIGFLLLFYAISRSASGKKYRRMSLCDRFRYLTQEDLRFLGYLGFRMEPDETLSEFYDRINRSDKQEIKDQTGFIPIYETVLYSDRNISEEDMAAAENINHSLRGLVKKSRLRYRIMLLFKKQ